LAESSLQSTASTEARPIIVAFYKALNTGNDAIAQVGVGASRLGKGPAGDRGTAQCGRAAAGAEATREACDARVQLNEKPIIQVSTKAWYAALERADIRDCRWHDLRHTWEPQSMNWRGEERKCCS